MATEENEREKAGLAVIEQLGWGQNEGVKELDEDLWRIVSEANFGTIWARPGLSLRDREVICIAMLVAIGAHGVALHFRTQRMSALVTMNQGDHPSGDPLRRVT